MRSLFGLWLVVATALFSLLAPARAEACSCSPQSIADALHEARAVFEGRVISVTHDPTQPDTLQVQLAAIRTWKGVDAETVTLTTTRDGASCGYTFVKDESYLVYAIGSDAALTASLCSRTRPIAEADQDLATLGAGAVPFAPRAPNLAPTDKLTVAPATNACAGCTVGARRESHAAWYAPLALALLLRSRRRPPQRRR